MLDDGQEDTLREYKKAPWDIVFSSQDIGDVIGAKEGRKPMQKLEKNLVDDHLAGPVEGPSDHDPPVHHGPTSPFPLPRVQLAPDPGGQVPADE